MKPPTLPGDPSVTLRSTLERRRRSTLKSGSLRMVRHLPGPCLATPALSAASSSGVQRCFGAPIAARGRRNRNQQTPTPTPARGSNHLRRALFDREEAGRQFDFYPARNSERNSGVGIRRGRVRGTDWSERGIRGGAAGGPRVLGQRGGMRGGGSH
jgi:hypothetical protein